MVDPQIVYLTSQLPSVISSTVNLTKIPDTCITLNRMSHEIFSITCDLHAMKICSVSHKTGSESREIESRTEISGPGYCSNALNMGCFICTHAISMIQSINIRYLYYHAKGICKM